MTTITTLNLRHGGGTRTRRILESLTPLSSDILVLTEFRNNGHGDHIKNGLLGLGYTHLYETNADPKLNSVLIASKQAFEAQTFPELGDHSQRVLKVACDDFTLFGTYFPGKDDKKYVFEFLLKYIQEHPNEKVIITGDINTGKHFIDEKGATFFHPEYLNKFEQQGYVDAWRHIHGDNKEFTWYSNSGNGFRIDHFFVHASLQSKIKDCFYNHQTRIDKITDHSMMTMLLN